MLNILIIERVHKLYISDCPLYRVRLLLLTTFATKLSQSPMSLFDLLFPQPSPNRCKKVTKNKIKNNHGDDNFGFVQINTVFADFVNERNDRELSEILIAVENKVDYCILRKQVN